jgi:hypothetical protein
MNYDENKAALIINIAADVNEVYNTLGKFLKPTKEGLYSKLTSNQVIGASDISPEFCEKPEEYTCLTGYNHTFEIKIDTKKFVVNGFIDWVKVVDTLSTYDKIYCPRTNSIFVISKNRYELCPHNSVSLRSVELLVIEYVKWVIDTHCQWCNQSFQKVFRFFNQDNPQVPHLDIEAEMENVCSELYRNITRFIGDDDWCVYTVGKLSNSNVVIYKGHDYRIIDWMKRYDTRSK